MKRILILLLVASFALPGCEGSDASDADGDIEWPSCPYYSELEPVPVIDYENHIPMDGERIRLRIYADKSYYMEKVDPYWWEGDSDAMDGKQYEGVLDVREFEQSLSVIEEYLPRLPCNLPVNCDDGSTGHIRYFKNADPDGHQVNYPCNTSRDLDAILNHFYQLATSIISDAPEDGDAIEGDKNDGDVFDGDDPDVDVESDGDKEIDEEFNLDHDLDEMDGDITEGEIESEVEDVDDMVAAWFADNNIYIPAEPMALDYEEAWDFCRSGQFFGQCGWRLPKLYELRTLISGCPATEPGSNCRVSNDNTSNCGWEGNCSGCSRRIKQDCLWDERIERHACPSAFWSTMWCGDGGAEALYTVHFENASLGNAWSAPREGLCHAEYGRGDLMDVLCIRDEESSGCHEPKYPKPYNERSWLDGGEIVTSSDGLQWTLAAESNKNAAEANSYCEGLNMGGHEDWRLPTIIELRSLAVGCSNLPTASFYGTDVPPDVYEPGMCCKIADESCLSASCLPNSDYENWCVCLTQPGWDNGCFWEAGIWDGDCQTAFRSASEVEDITGKHWALHYGDITVRTQAGWHDEYDQQIAPVADDAALVVRCVRGE